MAYVLFARGVDLGKTVDISEADYSTIVSAKDELLAALFLEEKFDALIENLLELETDLLGSTARYMLLGRTTHEWFQDERNLVNRRLLNLLSACRAYLDYARAYGRHALTTQPLVLAEFEASFATRFDANRGYRVMEAIRNYVQHRGFPIHSVQFRSSRDDHHPRRLLKYEVSVFAEPDYFREDHKFNSGVLKELDALGKEVDLKPLFRGYVSCLADIHADLREHVATILEGWEKHFTVFSMKFRSTHAVASDVMIVAAHTDGTLRHGEIALFSGIAERRKLLQRKNNSLMRLADRYVSGEVAQK